jgi:hypothetical protein
MRSSSSPSDRAWRASLQISRRQLLALAVLGVAGHAHAQSMQVPTSVQAELLVKVAGFDRNYKTRAGDDAASQRTALEMKSALAKVPSIADLPHEEHIVKSASAAAIAAAARERRAAIIYLGPGYMGQLNALRDAFSSMNVLTVGAVPDYVPSGAAVLGFDLVSGRPKLSIHVPQARKQQVAVAEEMAAYPDVAFRSTKRALVAPLVRTLRETASESKRVHRAAFKARAMTGHFRRVLGEAKFNAERTTTGDASD